MSSSALRWTRLKAVKKMPRRSRLVRGKEAESVEEGEKTYVRDRQNESQLGEGWKKAYSGSAEVVGTLRFS